MPKDETSTPDVIASVTKGIIKSTPIYEDALQPVAKEVGKSLGTLGKAINVALMPVEGLVWGGDKIRDFVHSTVGEKLKNTPVKHIKPPDLSVAGPAFESLRFVGHKESLSELYANLLANAIDERTATRAHPGFVEI